MAFGSKNLDLNSTSGCTGLSQVRVRADDLLQKDGMIMGVSCSRGIV